MVSKSRNLETHGLEIIKKSEVRVQDLKDFGTRKQSSIDPTTHTWEGKKFQEFRDKTLSNDQWGVPEQQCHPSLQIHWPKHWHNESFRWSYTDTEEQIKLNWVTA